MATSDSERIAYSIEQALEVLPISRTRLYGAIGSGEIRSFKHGKMRMVSRGALVEFVERLEREQQQVTA